MLSGYKILSRVSKFKIILLTVTQKPQLVPESHPPPSALKYCKLWDDFDFLSQFPVVQADQRVPTTWSHSTEDADTSASLKVVAPMERSDLLQVTLHGYQPPSRRGTTHGAAVSAVAAGPL